MRIDGCRSARFIWRKSLAELIMWLVVLTCLVGVHRSRWEAQTVTTDVGPSQGRQIKGLQRGRHPPVPAVAGSLPVARPGDGEAQRQSLRGCDIISAQDRARRTGWIV